MKDVDPAVIRSGRFDDKIEITLPKKNTRLQLTDYFLKKCPHENAISAVALAKATKGMTPADIKVLFNKAGNSAIAEKKEKRDKKSFVLALYEVIEAKRKQQIVSDAERERIITKDFAYLIFGDILSVLRQTKGMTSCEIADMTNFVRSLHPQSVDSCYHRLEDRREEILKDRILDKIEIAKHIYQFDDKQVKKVEKGINFKLLKIRSYSDKRISSEKIVEACESVALATA